MNNCISIYLFTHITIQLFISLGKSLYSYIHSMQISLSSWANRWISDREAAEFLKVSRHTLFIYRQKGLLPYVLLCGKILYREQDLEELLQRNYVPALR